MSTLKSLLEYLYALTTNMSDTAIVGIVANDVKALNSVYTNSTIIENCYNTLAPIALILCLAYLITGWTQESLNPKSTKEIYLKMFVRFICSCLLIINGFKIMTFFQTFFDSMTLEIIDKMYVASMTPVTDIPSFLGGIFEVACSLLFLYPQVIITVVYIIIVKVVLMKRSIDIGVHIVLSCLTMPSLILESKHSNFIMYLKRFAALCLQGGVIVTMVIISTIVMQEAFSVTGPFEDTTVYVFSWISILKDIVILLTMCSLLFKSRRISMDLVGGRDY